MATYEPLKHPSRRRRILTVVLIPLFAALVAWSLESGHWLVIYNDGPEILGEVQLQSGAEQWTVQDLEPRASRRFRVQGRLAADIAVVVPQWAAEPAYRDRHDWAETSSLSLRLGSDRTILATGESAFWQRWLNW